MSCIVCILINCSICCASGLLSPQFLLSLWFQKNWFFFHTFNQKIRLLYLTTKKESFFSPWADDIFWKNIQVWPGSWWLVSVYTDHLERCLCYKWYYRSRQEASNSSEFGGSWLLNQWSLVEGLLLWCQV